MKTQAVVFLTLKNGAIIGNTYKTALVKRFAFGILQVCKF
jgi:hypothetical protein